MSVLIKGMEMPKSCCDCRFMDEIDCTCIALNDSSTACFHGKPDWCPLTELPPHGRLIDADAIPWIEGKDEQDKPIYLLLKLQVEELPTIIESEKT